VKCVPSRLTREQVVPRPLDEVFAFFSDAANLEELTPPFLRFRILTPLPIRMAKGAFIEYACGCSASRSAGEA
jgi:ligand-binding SRPBCC domain-containing protein